MGQDSMHSYRMRALESYLRRRREFKAVSAAILQAALVELVAPAIRKSWSVRLREAYDNAVKAQKNGDWRFMDEYLDESSDISIKLAG